MRLGSFDFFCFLDGGRRRVPWPSCTGWRPSSSSSFWGRLLASPAAARLVGRVTTARVPFRSRLGVVGSTRVGGRRGVGLPADAGDPVAVLVAGRRRGRRPSPAGISKAGPASAALRRARWASRGRRGAGGAVAAAFASGALSAFSGSISIAAGCGGGGWRSLLGLLRLHAARQDAAGPEHCLRCSALLMSE